MKTKIIFLFAFSLFVCYLPGQSYQPGKLWVSIISEEARSENDSSTFNEQINNIFRDFNVSSYQQVMGFAKTPHLRKIYEISCDCDQLALMQELSQLSPSYFGFIEQVYEPIPLYTPNDGVWGYSHGSWHLKRIKADSAWDITIGNPLINVGVIDQAPDITHPDLESQIYPHCDPLTRDQFTALLDDDFEAHGTPVASFVAARTAETGTYPSPNGYLASIGFNTKMIAYRMNLPAAVHASTVMGADIITNSWFEHCNWPGDSIAQIYLESIQEILNNGTVILVAAGNGCMISCYNDEFRMTNKCDTLPEDFMYFSPTYPFHPTFDERIIIVTSTDSLDYHTQINPENGDNITHSQFPDIDVCSPGYDIMGATNTLWDSSGYIVKKLWPYYHLFGGTSFSTPIVAGLCGLIKSINPCLTPEQVQFILKETADPVTDANLYPGELGAGRINAYQAVKYAQENYGYEEYLIGCGQDITWTTEVQAKKITIEWGGKLTIKSTVYMLPGSDIVVLRGGNLIVDGGHITTCKGLWNGIQVRGKIDLDQYFFYNQGHLTLKNEAIIENAKCGVQTIKVDAGGSDPYSTGGIVQATDASFINCVTGVAFYPYENFLNDKKNIKNNLSYLNHCNFILDTNYNHIFFNPKQFIYMEDIRGISIKGCTFSNQIKSSDYEDVTLIDPDHMVGIFSLNAAFTVDEYCLNPVFPCDTAAPCQFENLYYAIYALNGHSEKYPVIEMARFIKNKTGIYLGAVNNAVMRQNCFDVRAPHDIIYVYPDPLFTGIYTDHCTSYCIEENYFGSNYLAELSPHTLGIVINSSGPFANEVYKNNFNRLEYGVIAMNENKRDTVGLCIKCNNFDSCAYDISVVVDTAISGWGIAEYQGSREDTTTAPAGNVFTWNFSAHDFDLQNADGADPFTYYHHREILFMTPNLEPDLYSPSVSPVLNDQRYDPDESCPSRIGGGGNPSLEKIKIEDANNQVTSIESELDILTDGGSTPDLTMDVSTSTPPEAFDLTNQLLGESPYLSDTVMKSAIEKEDVLTNAMIRDVLVENPQSAKSGDIMQMLDERIDPMPEYMKDQIAQGKFTTGDKENLEAHRSFYLSEQTRAFNNLNRIYQSDSTVSYRLDSLASLFDNLSSLENQYRKAFIQAENGDTIVAVNTIDSIPVEFSLTGEQAGIHGKYEDLLDIIIDLSNPERSVMDLDSAHIAELLDIHDDHTLPGIYARNMLVTAGYLTYQEPYLFPDNLKKMQVKPLPAGVETVAASIRAFPNPSTYYTIVEYDFCDAGFKEVSSVSIIIRDVRGITQKSLVSTHKKDQLVLDVRSFMPGLYFIDLLIEGKRLSTSKLIVER